jgi:hypothetical protein
MFLEIHTHQEKQTQKILKSRIQKTRLKLIVYCIF